VVRSQGHKKAALIDIPYYLIALLLTIGLEVPVAAVAGFRRAKEVAAVALVSVCTHPILSVALAALPRYLDDGARLAALTTFEIGVVIAEWKLLAWALRREDGLLISAAMNSISMIVGLVFFW
jgi:hypothetical protein